MNRLTQAKRARTRAWKRYKRLKAATYVDSSLLLAAREKYRDAEHALRIAEWEAAGGPAGNVPRPVRDDNDKDD